MSHAQASLPHFDDPTDFEQWALNQFGKWELHDGVPVAMSPERSDHARIKAQCWLALRTALRGKSLSCEPFIDGLLIPGPGSRRFQPDVLVACGDRVAPGALLVEQPVILVEVLSPSTEVADNELKLESYFQLPSVQHYLLISTRKRLVLHHSRLDDGRLLTSLHTTGPIELTHPGVQISVEDVYEDVEFD